MKWTISRRVKHPETRSWALGHAAWLSLLLSHLALTTVRGAPNVVAWGADYDGQKSVPANLTNAVAVVAGENHSLALRADGTVVAWGTETHVTNGWSSYGPATVPDGLTNVVAVATGATGESRSLALRADGTVIAWGAYDGDQTNVPAGLTNVVAVAAGSSHSLVLRSDGTVFAWGKFPNSGLYRPMTVPIGLSNVVAVAAGYSHSLALRADGTVVAWGDNEYGQTRVPPDLTNVVVIAGGRDHSLALRADGTVVAWGANWGGQTNVPASLANVVAVAGGDCHSLALRADGTVIAWGDNEYGRTNVPAGLANVVAVAGGAVHSLAVIGSGAPFRTTPLVDRQIFVGGTVYFRAAASGAPPLRYQWQFNGTNLPGATNSLLVLADVRPTQAGAYSVVVSNAFGRVSSSTAHLEAVPILLNAQPQSEVIALGETVTFSVEARATAPSYQWRFNGNDLPGATNSMLTLANLRLDQAGEYSVVVSNAWGTVTSWEADLHVVVVKGWDAYTGEEVYLPADLTNIVQVVATGFDFGMLSLTLRADGTVVAWATSLDGTPSGAVLPPGLTNVVALAAGGHHGVALRADGTVTSWDSFSGDPLDVPPDLTGVVAVAAGAHGYHSLALRADGTIVTWGSKGLVAPEVPAGLTNVVAIAGGTDHSLALRVDGTVAAWGIYWDGTTNVPVTVPPGLTNVVAVAGGHQHSLALRTDGTVVAWGFYWDGTTNIPMTVPPGLTNVVAVAAGWNRNLALRADGTVVAWGSGSATNVPSGLTNVVAMSDGFVHSLALLGDGPPVVTASLSDPALAAVGFSVSLPTQIGRVFVLEYKNSLEDATWTSLPLVAGTGHEQTLTDPTARGVRRFYRVRRW